MEGGGFFLGNSLTKYMLQGSGGTRKVRQIAGV